MDDSSDFGDLTDFDLGGLADLSWGNLKTPACCATSFTERSLVSLSLFQKWNKKECEIADSDEKSLIQCENVQLKSIVKTKSMWTPTQCRSGRAT